MSRVVCVCVCLCGIGLALSAKLFEASADWLLFLPVCHEDHTHCLLIQLSITLLCLPSLCRVGTNVFLWSAAVCLFCSWVNFACLKCYPFLSWLSLTIDVESLSPLTYLYRRSLLLFTDTEMFTCRVKKVVIFSQCFCYLPIVVGQKWVLFGCHGPVWLPW